MCNFVIVLKRTSSYCTEKISLNQCQFLLFPSFSLLGVIVVVSTFNSSKNTVGNTAGFVHTRNINTALFFWCFWISWNLKHLEVNTLWSSLQIQTTGCRLPLFSWSLRAVSAASAAWRIPSKKTRQNDCILRDQNSSKKSNKKTFHKLIMQNIDSSCCLAHRTLSRSVSRSRTKNSADHVLCRSTPGEQTPLPSWHNERPPQQPCWPSPTVWHYPVNQT